MNKILTLLIDDLMGKFVKCVYHFNIYEINNSREAITKLGNRAD